MIEIIAVLTLLALAWGGLNLFIDVLDELT